MKYLNNIKVRGKLMFSIVIIDYFSYLRTYQFTRDFINNCIYSELNIIIVDNSSSDENFNKLKDCFEQYGILTDLNKIIKNSNFNYYDDIKNIYAINHNFENKKIKFVIIQNKENFGFAKGNNIGASVSRCLFNPKYLIFSNNDILFNNGKLDLNIFIKYFNNNNKIALIGPKVIGLDNKIQSPHKYLSIWKRLFILHMFWPITNIVKRISNMEIGSDIVEVYGSKYVYRVIGAFMVFDADKFLEIKMFDEETFMYAEELIIAEKIKSERYLTLYIDDVVITHEEGYTTKKNLLKSKKMDLMFNSFIYYYKNYINEKNYIIYLVKLNYAIFKIRNNIIKKIYMQFNNKE